MGENIAPNLQRYSINDIISNPVSWYLLNILYISSPVYHPIKTLQQPYDPDFLVLQQKK